MELERKIHEQIHAAMKMHDEIRLSALRSVIVAITMEMTKPGSKKELTDQEIEKLIQKLIKQREDSIEQYSKAGREDLTDIEKREKEVLEEFVPKPLTLEEATSIIKDIIIEKKVFGIKYMGVIMKEVSKAINGRFDGAKVAEIVKEELTKTIDQETNTDK